MEFELEPRVCSGERDAVTIANFCGRIFRPSVEHWARSLMSGRHPAVRREHFVVVSEADGRVVSSLCQIPQAWRYEGATLKVGQIELVGTDPDYRRRGLVRSQMRLFDEMLREQGCVLSCVQGIPGVYQRLGYEYAVPLKGGVRLWLGQLPRPSGAGGYALRPCEPSDIPALAALYDEESRRLLLSSARDEALWLYQETQPEESEHAYETFVLERAGGAAGYFRLPRHAKASAVVVRELSVGSYEGFLAVLDFARSRALERGFDSVILQLPASHRAAEAARYLGAETITPFAWQVRVVDWPGLFERIAPVLERRLADSLMAGWTGRLVFRFVGGGALALTFRDGRFERAGEAEAGADWSVESPPGLACQLVLGYRAGGELAAWHPDFQVRPPAQLLVNTLFPKRDSFVYEAY